MKQYELSTFSYIGELEKVSMFSYRMMVVTDYNEYQAGENCSYHFHLIGYNSNFIARFFRRIYRKVVKL